jgi:hypothetical protein
MGCRIAGPCDATGPGAAPLELAAPEAEFEQLQPPAAEPGLRVDHIGMAVASHELHSALLFYRTVLGLDRRPLVESPGIGGATPASTSTHARSTACSSSSSNATTTSGSGPPTLRCASPLRLAHLHPDR